MPHEHSDYEAQTIRVLGSFQVLEFSIKMYIAAAYKTIKAKLDGTIPFGYDFDHIDNFPLERLLNVFSRLNSDTALQTRLNKLRGKRNDVAHRTLMYRHDIVRELLEVDIQSHAIDLSSTETELDECLHLMAKELEFIVGKYNEAAA